MKAFWYKHNIGNGNFGDEISPIILQFFLGKNIEWAHPEENGKILAVGSIIAHSKENDVIWGSGLIADQQGRIPNTKILALRGLLTARNLRLSCDTYGDPAILMPLLYKPNTDKIYKRGYVPHYIDQKEFLKTKLGTDELFINALNPWQKVIDNIYSCEEIISSSLHGIILAEAYGIPAIYQPSYSGKVIGGDFKFKDYLLGTGRNQEDLYKTPIPPIKDLELRQQLLIDKLKKWQADL